jgi:hypothetical protein
VVFRWVLVGLVECGSTWLPTEVVEDWLVSSYLDNTGPLTSQSTGKHGRRNREGHTRTVERSQCGSARNSAIPTLTAE